MMVNSGIRKITELISPIFLKTIDPITKEEIRYFESMLQNQVSIGGRASFKTTVHTLKVILLLMKYPFCDWVSLRKNKNTIHKSLFAAIIEACAILGLKNGVHYFAPFHVTPHTNLYFRLKNGSSIMFDGMIKDAGDSKGIKPSIPGKSVIVGIWFFEADQLLENDDSFSEAFNKLENYAASFIRDSFSSYWDKKPFFIKLWEWNPPANKNHFAYELEKMFRKDPNAIVLTTRYYDHPIELLKKWLGVEAIRAAENLKMIDIEQWKAVYGALPAKLEGGCYPKYNIDNSNISSIEMTPEYVVSNYNLFFCGVDTGTTDATVFTFIGIRYNQFDVPKIGILNRYYWKNNVSKDKRGMTIIKDDNDFAYDFNEFIKKCSTYTNGKVFYTEFESADPGAKLIYTRYLLNQKNNSTIIEGVNKMSVKSSKSGKSSITERVKLLNVVLNVAKIEYNINEDVLGLDIALQDAKWDKHGNRLDDGSTDIDSIDSLEYSLMYQSTFRSLAEETIRNYKGE